MVGLEHDVIEIFKSYPWPGNVRELKNVIKRAALLSDGNHIQVKALPFEIINYTKLDFGAPDMQEELVASVAIKKPQSVSIDSHRVRLLFSIRVCLPHSFFFKNDERT